MRNNGNRRAVSGGAGLATRLATGDGKLGEPRPTLGVKGDRTDEASVLRYERMVIARCRRPERVDEIPAPVAGFMTAVAESLISALSECDLLRLPRC